MKKDIKYEMVVYWSVDDDGYIAEVPELPGCMADGRTYEEAIKNTLTVIKEWIEMLWSLEGKYQTKRQADIRIGNYRKN